MPTEGFVKPYLLQVKFTKKYSRANNYRHPLFETDLNLINTVDYKALEMVFHCSPLVYQHFFRMTIM